MVVTQATAVEETNGPTSSMTIGPAAITTPYGEAPLANACFTQVQNDYV